MLYDEVAITYAHEWSQDDVISWWRENSSLESMYRMGTFLALDFSGIEGEVGVETRHEKVESPNGRRKSGSLLEGFETKYMWDSVKLDGKLGSKRLSVDCRLRTTWDHHVVKRQREDGRWEAVEMTSSRPGGDWNCLHAFYSNRRSSEAVIVYRGSGDAEGADGKWWFDVQAGIWKRHL